MEGTQGGAPGGVIPPLVMKPVSPSPRLGSPPFLSPRPPRQGQLALHGQAWGGGTVHPRRGQGPRYGAVPTPQDGGCTKGGGAAAPKSDGKAKTPTPTNHPPQAPPGHLPPLSPPRPAATHLMPGTPHTSSCRQLFGGDPSVLLLSLGHPTTPWATRPCAVATAEPPRRSAHPRACGRACDGASERASPISQPQHRAVPPAAPITGAGRRGGRAWVGGCVGGCVGGGGGCHSPLPTSAAGSGSFGTRGELAGIMTKQYWLPLPPLPRHKEGGKHK